MQARSTAVGSGRMAPPTPPPAGVPFHGATLHSTAGTAPREPAHSKQQELFIGMQDVCSTTPLRSADGAGHCSHLDSLKSAHRVV